MEYLKNLPYVLNNDKTRNFSFWIYTSSFGIENKGKRLV